MNKNESFRLAYTSDAELRIMLHQLIPGCASVIPEKWHHIAYKLLSSGITLDNTLKLLKVFDEKETPNYVAEFVVELELRARREMIARKFHAERFAAGIKELTKQFRETIQPDLTQKKTKRNPLDRKRWESKEAYTKRMRKRR